MIPYARLQPGRGFQADRALLYYLQRLVTLPVPRRGLSALIATAMRRAQGVPMNWPMDPTCRTAFVDLKRDGIASLPTMVSRAAIRSMADYFLTRPVVGPNGEMARLNALPAGTVAASYPLSTVLECPGLLGLLNAPQILRIACEYLGCKPTISSVGVRWTFPSRDRAARFQSFHRDIDDWRFLKIFTYLTDVDEDCGPHCFARTSHKTAFSLAVRAYTPAEVEARFGADRIVTVTGPVGTTFMADTIGVHRGGRPRTRPRLILQAQYSLLPIFAFLYQPTESFPLPIDPYCNRLLVQTCGSAW